MRNTDERPSKLKENSKRPCQGKTEKAIAGGEGEKKQKDPMVRPREHKIQFSSLSFLHSKLKENNKRPCQGKREKPSKEEREKRGKGIQRPDRGNTKIQFSSLSFPHNIGLKELARMPVRGRPHMEG